LPDTPSTSNVQIQRFLRARTLDYEETQANLRLRVPCYIFNASLADSHAGVSDESIATTAVAVNRRTGSFVVPELGIAGTWSELETLLNAWYHNRNARPKESKLGKYPDS